MRSSGPAEWTSLAEAPVYSFLSRIPFVLTTWFSEGGRQPLPSLFDQQMPPLAGFYLPVFIQHLLLIAALTYIVTALTQNRVVHRLQMGMIRLTIKHHQTLEPKFRLGKVCLS